MTTIKSEFAKNQIVGNYIFPNTKCRINSPFGFGFVDFICFMPVYLVHFKFAARTRGIQLKYPVE